MRLTRALMIGLTLSFISCASKPKILPNSLSESVIAATKPGPDIATDPESAFFPLRIDPSDNKIKPSFQSKVCVKTFIICVKWEKITLFFEDLSWFRANGFGLKKIEHIK